MARDDELLPIEYLDEHGRVITPPDPEPPRTPEEIRASRRRFLTHGAAGVGGFVLGGFVGRREGLAQAREDRPGLPLLLGPASEFTRTWPGGVPEDGFRQFTCRLHLSNRSAGWTTRTLVSVANVCEWITESGSSLHGEFGIKNRPAGSEPFAAADPPDRPTEWVFYATLYGPPGTFGVDGSAGRQPAPAAKVEDRGRTHFEVVIPGIDPNQRAIDVTFTIYRAVHDQYRAAISFEGQELAAYRIGVPGRVRGLAANRGRHSILNGSGFRQPLGASRPGYEEIQAQCHSLFHDSGIAAESSAAELDELLHGSNVRSQNAAPWTTVVNPGYVETTQFGRGPVRVLDDATATVELDGSVTVRWPAPLTADELAAPDLVARAAADPHLAKRLAITVATEPSQLAGLEVLIGPGRRTLEREEPQLPDSSSRRAAVAAGELVISPRDVRRLLDCGGRLAGAYWSLGARLDPDPAGTYVASQAGVDLPLDDPRDRLRAMRDVTREAGEPFCR